MGCALAVVWCYSLYALRDNLGKAKNKPRFTDIFSKSRSINILSGARLFLFGARDVWFVVALPVFLSQIFNWQHWTVSAFLALWVVGYGFVQSITPKLILLNKGISPAKETCKWALLLSIVTITIVLSLYFQWFVEVSLLVGLMLFGIIFAINSSLHSYLIVSMADADGVSLDVGFYYTANAMGRLIGTLLSGWIFQLYGLQACLVISFLFIILAAILSMKLPPLKSQNKNNLTLE
jgi:predicted MFS family arabinose efflux permease